MTYHGEIAGLLARIDDPDMRRPTVIGGWATRPRLAVPVDSSNEHVSQQDSSHQDAMNLHGSALQELLLTNETLEEFLHDLVTVAAQETGHHCGVTVAGRRDGDDYTVTSSDALSAQLDERQYLQGEGPCLAALRTKLPVFVTDMATETRWAPYPQDAMALGVHSSLSYPLISAEEGIGALNFYGDRPLTPDQSLQARAAAIAEHVAGALALALRLAERDDLISNLRLSLTSRSTIDQAIGILMAQQRCSVESAFELLRTASQARNIKLRDIAAGIVSQIEREEPGSRPGRY